MSKPELFNQTTASDIVTLLAKRHDEDLFVSECKNGSSQMMSDSLRLDAWAMKKSWSKPAFYGYEIKVSRSDFLNDDKWTGYQKYCTHFSFVCPSGLIALDELPAGVGLIYVSKNGKKLYTKRKALPQSMEYENLDTLMRYVLMNRVKIVDSTFGYIQKDPKQFWSEWLEARELDRVFGQHVSKAIRETIEKKIDAVGKENESLKRKISAYEKLHDALVDGGKVVGELGDVQHYKIDNVTDEIKRVVPFELVRNTKNAFEALKRLNDIFEEL